MNFAKPLSIFTILSMLVYSGNAQEGSHKHKHEGSHKKSDAHVQEEGSHHKAEGSSAHKHGGMVKVKGEVLDLVCYLSNEAKGKGHKDCASSCIKNGLPVGIKSESDGKLYLLVGDHKPLNEKLADYAAKTIEVEGKLATRDGVSMIENAVIIE